MQCCAATAFQCHYESLERRERRNRRRRERDRVRLASKTASSSSWPRKSFNLSCSMHMLCIYASLCTHAHSRRLRKCSSSGSPHIMPCMSLVSRVMRRYDQSISECHFLGEGIEASDKAKGVFLVDLPGKSDAQCMLQFCPQTVCYQDKISNSVLPSILYYRWLHMTTNYRC